MTRHFFGFYFYAALYTYRGVVQGCPARVVAMLLVEALQREYSFIKHYSEM